MGRFRRGSFLVRPGRCRGRSKRYECHHHRPDSDLANHNFYNYYLPPFQDNNPNYLNLNHPLTDNLPIHNLNYLTPYNNHPLPYYLYSCET